MKHLLPPLLLMLFVSCEVEGDLTRNDATNQMIPESSSMEYSGTFVPTQGIAVSGTAEIYLDGSQYKVKLQNFSISDGPDLKVYLSKTETPQDFVNLGNLTSATVYPIPPQANVATYHYVLIHCQQYNHLFAVAPLTEN